MIDAHPSNNTASAARHSDLNMKLAAKWPGKKTRIQLTQVVQGQCGIYGVPLVCGKGWVICIRTRTVTRKKGLRRGVSHCTQQFNIGIINTTAG